ncbi:biotin--[acetyl-CoA-carboxylase] ligase 1 [Dictyostelium discoideum AX4]|uniref:Biotin--[acetyl-CoA-carboxylase] ligase 1 n=1 Tax=Dictyostelium discoideum TaxID=44689 RepID=Q54IF5_DICDI|nr:biotin--[acetyl-CoA-carboxylase] ligase 1 [Dictyostelium discoideum AX4]EAL63017.1 biotin--[acetyl-CoA-carboxylase] ligase 1 [Dictyostelium discoideum AX4]|eukprot:XP_636522.1 biotin--[acetyl-CoA-carboxylase] ligase 1 [Dictyostelium discoideum AX4]
MIDSDIELNKIIVVPLISKDSLDINDAKNYYGTELYPNQPIPTIVSAQSEVDSLINQTSGNNDEERLVLLLKQQQQEVEKDKTFDTNKYFNELSTILFGKNLIHSEVISSTQDIMLKYLTYTRQGLVMIADQQTKGRGRGVNKFLSPLGCLLMSFKCKQTDGNKLPFLQYLAGMAMVEAIHSFPSASDLNLRLKWPNDIYSNEPGMKVGGVLCESNYLNNEFDVVIGVGVNLSNSNNPSTTINQLIQKKKYGFSSSSLATSTDIPIYISREELVSKFFNKFEPMFMEFTRDGFNADLENRYTDLWMHTNQIVKFKERDNHHVKIIGISDSGFLKAIECDADGNTSSDSETVELHPDGTSFDIQNLILMQKSQQPK